MGSLRGLQRGDHLRVRRPNLYSHHGIYAGDDRVIEFGGEPGGNKTQAIVRSVSLDDFAQRGRAEVVKHPTRSRLGMWLPGAIPNEEIVARAEWLVAYSVAGRYNLLGHNCEQIANWCVAGGFFESLQVRRWFMAQGLFLGVAILLWPKLRPPLWLAGLLAALTLVTPYIYNREAYRFWKDVGRHWPWLSDASYSGRVCLVRPSG